MRRPIALSAFLVLLFSAGVANASWYDDYDAGVAAARSGNWSVVVTKMTAAIKGNANENNRARTYGAIFINYHPYYYRGVANANLGKYEQAISDLERTSGPGELDLGPIGQHLERAKKMLASASAPEPEPAPVRPTPAVSVPAAPQIDPALRQRAQNALAGAKQKIQAAQQRRANTSPQFAQAMSIYTDASSRNASARTNDDLNSIIAMAENAGDMADLAAAPSASAPAPAIATQPVPAPITPKPTAAASTVLSDYNEQVRRALEYYFAGDFDLATREFDDLTRKMPRNAWIWAFLGASQYSQYAFEADDRYRRDAERSFRQAKNLRKWNGGLPERYFSKRIRKAFDEPAG